MSNIALANNTSSSYSYNSSPNPAKLIESLRHLGYDNYSALADIIDNSFDAEASHIKVLIRQKNKQQEIIIADNGHGMDAHILGQAIRLGSNTEKNAESDLGKFGMGLCTASLSICRQTTVITKTADGKMLKAVNDVDEVIRQNAFVSYLGEPTFEDKALFEELLGDSESGTVIALRKCDNLSHSSNTTNFANLAIKEFARIFRNFIKAGIKISVNDKELSAIDPLEWDDPKTEHYDDGFIEIEVANEDGKTVTEKVAIKLAFLKPNEEKGEKERDFNQRTQGFYVMRNNREILSANALGLFIKHNYLNRFRGEISFSGNLDKLFGINFTKKNVAMHQSLSDKLAAYISPQVASIKNREQKKTRKETPENITEIHQDAAKEIGKKAKLLMRPKAPKEKRESTGETPERKSSATEPNRTREPGENKQEGFAANCEFKAASMGTGGVMFDSEQRGRTTVITYNSDHPFYQKFILGYGETDRGLVAGIDYLIYSLACAELAQNLEEDDVAQLVNNFKTIVSTNLRTLLS
ncbi:MAG: ATP-binding protein [Alphaproteobacteria bacterium]|nr:ATP-binding protein [Alphaproteobacteria bacterium]